jgi:hypothetical protein
LPVGLRDFLPGLLPMLYQRLLFAQLCGDAKERRFVPLDGAQQQRRCPVRVEPLALGSYLVSERFQFQSHAIDCTAVAP